MIHKIETGDRIVYCNDKFFELLEDAWEKIMIKGIAVELFDDSEIDVWSNNHGDIEFLDPRLVTRLSKKHEEPCDFTLEAYEDYKV